MYFQNFNVEMWKYKYSLVTKKSHFTSFIFKILHFVIVKLPISSGYHGVAAHVRKHKQSKGHRARIATHHQISANRHNTMTCGEAKRNLGSKPRFNLCVPIGAIALVSRPYLDP